MRLVLFDFDGTLTRKDTLFEFMKYTHGKVYFYFSFLIFLPLIIYTKLNGKNFDHIKEKMLSYYYKGITEEKLAAIATNFHDKVVRNLYYTSALKVIQQYALVGDKVVIVSASMNIWLNPVADYLDIELVCTRAKYENGKFSGKFDGKNCIREEKANRVRQAYNLDDFNEIIAYGDSGGDKEMLRLADKSFYQHFSG